MKEKHPLHEDIGGLLLQLNADTKYEVLLDEVLGGNQHISLFVNNEQTINLHRDNNFCDVDALIMQEGKVKVIIEIEESKNIPTHICGKYLTSALATHYRENEIEKHSVLFVQIIADRFPEKTKKENQLQLIEQEIGKIQVGIIKKYKLFIVSENEKDEVNKQIMDSINDFLQNKA